MFIIIFVNWGLRMEKKFLIFTGFLFLIIIIAFCGCNDTQKSIDVPNDNPAIACLANVYQGTVPLNVSFSINLINFDKIITSYNWNFGDGQTSKEENPKHIFNSIGTYNVTCTATDSQGTFYNNSIQIRVIGTTNSLPTAIIDAEPLGGEAPLTVSFMGIGFDDDGVIVSYKWTFNDANGIKTSNQRNPVYTFNEEGTFLVTLTVTDNKGGSNTDTVYITVKENDPMIKFYIDEIERNNYIEIYDGLTQINSYKSKENYQFVVVPLTFENHENKYIEIQIDDLWLNQVLITQLKDYQVEHSIRYII